MVDGGKQSNRRKPKGDLQWRCGEAGDDCRQPHTDKKDCHHVDAAPFIRKIRRQGRTSTEQNQRGNAVRNHVRIGPVFRKAERNSGAERRLCENQHEKMVEKMAKIEIGKAEFLLCHGDFLSEIAARPWPVAGCYYALNYHEGK